MTLKFTKTYFDFKNITYNFVTSQVKSISKVNLLCTVLFKPCQVCNCLPLSFKQSETCSDFKHKTKPLGDIDCSFVIS